jgi:tripeptide aminopeptidase
VTPEELAALHPAARLMVRLCEIPSPSRMEGPVAEAVRAELRALGAEVGEDDAAARIGAGCGNIVGRFPPTADGGTPIVLCAHLDTVPLTGPVEVELVDGHLTNRHDAILGGDDKCAVAVMIEAMRRVRDEGLPHAGVELLFTPCEEIGLRGAAAFDPAALRGRFAFVYDHTGPIGNVVVSAPSLHKVRATFIGRAAHAGIAPEAGRSAIDAAARAIGRMRLGRIDPETTANVGTIAGGTATNVVSERCELTAEARSRDERALAVQLTAMLDALTWAASECEVDLETRVDKDFTSYRLAEDDPQVRMAVEVLTALGHRPAMVASGGGSDVNALIHNGFPAVNLCNGMIDIHTPDERVALESLEAMFDVTLGLIDAARRE